MKKSFFVFCLAAFCFAVSADDDAVALPRPSDNGKTLLQTMKQRRTRRDMINRPLSLQELSNIFYAAYGINRPDGRHVVPSARAMFDTMIYAATPSGLYRYRPEIHRLELVRRGDFRTRCGRQTEMFERAPLVLIYVSDWNKLGNLSEIDKIAYGATHAGFSIQNVYLYAAGAGLSTVVCGAIDRPEIEKLLGFDGSRKVLYTQPIGFAAEK